MREPANWLYERALAYLAEGDLVNAEKFRQALDRVGLQAVVHAKERGLYVAGWLPPECGFARLLRMKIGYAKQQVARRRPAASYQAREPWLREPWLTTRYIWSGPVPLVRTAPCPCGSGKLFSSCHGKDSQK